MSISADRSRIVTEIYYSRALARLSLIPGVAHVVVMVSHSTGLESIFFLRLPRSAMSYVEKHLIEGETIVYETRLHWIVLIVPILLGLLFGLTGVAMFVLSGRAAGGKSAASESMTIIGAVLLVLALLFIARVILVRNATEMTVTNKRVFVKVGLAARRTIELLLSRVESIGVEESVMGRMFGYGKVIVHGTGGTPEIFTMIAHPLEFRTQVQQEIENSQANSR
jgi:membrane protein YdbS with pleckstrin-like domain